MISATNYSDLAILKQRNRFLTENTHISKLLQGSFSGPSESWWIWTGFRSLLSSAITTNKQISPGKPSTGMSTRLQLLDQLPTALFYLFSPVSPSHQKRVYERPCRMHATISDSSQVCDRSASSTHTCSHTYKATLHGA